ncbi:four helix bundle protein [Draconibacterium orientale]|jgi:four helix bundle protein|uniref:Four helix bundle protein n=1 Tax=Draconibacterium orientale TaxID=1168034 RepID=X5DEV3_9BACT|nr:four helix bundle protein [Draconibacterium orientale]AHW58887.1 S23 ribosomal protein [Draconibacterium orientale]SEU04385.1 four helix bundle protein [Draconibacterium orientale]
MDFKELIVYQKAFRLAMDIFEVSKTFPKEEKYSLTDQVRRSSRSTCTNVAEAYRKRRYPKHFLSKLTDSDGENSETATWLDFAFACKYLNNDIHERLNNECVEIGKLLNYMMNHPEKFGSAPVL